MRNKKADIPITILVLGVITLCVFALLVFYLSETKQKSGGVNSFFYLQEIYNPAESVKYSGADTINNYKDIKIEDSKFVIEKTFSIENGWIFKNKKEVLSVTYAFEP